MTEQNKKEFEKWYLDFTILYHSKKENKVITIDNDVEIKHFYKLPFEMQIGVYLAYYDSLGICIDTKTYFTHQDIIVISYNIECVDIFEYTDVESNMFDSRNEAYKEAFKKANEIRNKQLKG